MKVSLFIILHVVLAIASSGLKAYGYLLEGDLSTRVFIDSLMTFLLISIFLFTGKKYKSLWHCIMVVFPITLIFNIVTQLNGWTSFGAIYMGIYSISVYLSAVVAWLFFKYKNKNPFVAYPSVFTYLGVLSAFTFYFIPNFYFNYSTKVVEKPILYTSSLRNMDNQNLTIDEFRGKVTIVEFWGKGCGICFDQLPYLDKMKKMYKDEVNFLAVNVGRKKWYNLQEAIKAMQKYGPKGYQFQLVHDDNANFTDTYLEDDGLPYTLIIDKKGVIRYIHSGFPLDERSRYLANMEIKINQLLSE